MHGPLPPPDPVTAEWLTVALRQAGRLRGGEVSAVEHTTTGAFNSHTSRLVLRYSADASSDAPTRLVLKRNTSDAWAIEAGADEVKFYQLVAPLHDHPPVIVPCYAAAYDERSGDSYLLFQDLSETHRPPITRDQQIGIVEGVPAAEDIAAVVDALARLHAYWWDSPQLATAGFEVGYWSRDAERFERYLRRRRTSWEDLLAAEGAWFSDDLRNLYELVLARLPRHWERHLEPRFRAMQRLTLVHGDAYFANFLCPKTPGTGATYLLDWQSPTFDIGGHDLANLCAAFWTPQQRHDDQREERMLRRYHTVVRQHGVEDYTWDELLTDYQIGLIYWLLVPVQDRHDGSDKAYWWPKMQCIVAAFREWHCEDLLGL